MNLRTPLAFVFALALLFCAVVSVHAQPANGAPPNSSSDSSTPEHVKGLPSDEALLRQHLASDDSAPAPNANTAGKARPGPGGGAPGSVQGVRGAQQEETSGVAAAVKDFVKPLHQEVTNSSVVQAVRQLDAVVSGKGQPDVENGPANSALRNADSAGRAGSRKPDSNAAALMWTQFVDDVLPWAAGGAVVGLLGCGVYFWLKMLKLKNLRLGDKRRAVRKTRRVSNQLAQRANASPTVSDSVSSSAFEATAQGAIDGSAPSAESRRSANRSSGSTLRRKSRRSII